MNWVFFEFCRRELSTTKRNSGIVKTHIEEILEAGAGDLTNSVPSAERSEGVRDGGLGGGEGELKGGPLALTIKFTREEYVPAHTW